MTRCRSQPPARRSGGFSLLECMIAMIVMGVGALGIGKLQWHMTSQAGSARQRVEAFQPGRAKDRAVACRPLPGDRRRHRLARPCRRYRLHRLYPSLACPVIGRRPALRRRDCGGRLGASAPAWPSPSSSLRWSPRPIPQTSHCSGYSGRACPRTRPKHATPAFRCWR